MESKKPASEETGKMNGLPCVLLQDAGGTSAYSPLPDTQAVSYGITDPLRGQVLGNQIFNCKDPPVGSLPVLANTIYNQVKNEQEVVWMKIVPQQVIANG